jgi:hypothetical protein
MPSLPKLFSNCKEATLLTVKGEETKLSLPRARAVGYTLTVLQHLQTL